MYKGYNKKATSDKTMRIDKRERILPIILGNASLEKMSLFEIKKDEDSLYEKISNIKNNIPVKLTIREPINRKEYFYWKLSLIRSTNWLYQEELNIEEDSLTVSWKDTRKLRIFYKWIYKSNKKTYETVLKYMYSPLFLIIISLELGEIVNGSLRINTGITYGQSAEFLKNWMKDILDLDSEVDKLNGHAIVFSLDSTEKAVKMIKEEIKDSRVYSHLIKEEDDSYGIISA